jgi:Tfp pilus assembly protein PilF
MALFKCKMCGGTLEINNNETVATCEYCGTQQTLPKLDDDRRANMYDRANHFRRNNEFDKAMGIYENILNEDNTDAEAYWSLVLCRYGIEYVEDPSSHKRIPTVNRAQFTSIFDDDNYKSALQYADGYQRSIYEEEAKAINEIQKGILAISQKEEPFDVFVCYKETDNNGRRTPDSVLANDLYHQLTQEGFKVFFARITLEDKLGSAYEPYIFAALNSAKVMVVLGTKPEFFNAVWVKNEWSRYLALIKQGQKKMLIPAYKDMDPYDLPEEFSHLQAQDMSKLGFMQDLIRGIKKIAKSDEPKTTVVKETVISGGNANTAPLLERAFMFLEDGDWNSANEYCEKVLDNDPKNAQAYLGKLMAEQRVKKQDKLKDCDTPFDNSNNYQKAVRFADDKLKAALAGYIEHINTRNENARLDGIYTRAKNAMSAANTESAYKDAAQLFESVSEYQDSAALAQSCYEKAEVARKDAILAGGKAKMTGEVISNYETAIKLFESISGWKDADEQIYACQKKIEEIKAKDEARRLERERNAEIARKEAEKRAKRNKKIAIITTSIVCAIIAFIIVLNTVIIPNGKYEDALALMEATKYSEAITVFEELEGYKDSTEKINESTYLLAKAHIESKDYDSAIEQLLIVPNYKDSATLLSSTITAVLQTENINALSTVPDDIYKSDTNNCYDYALKLFNSKNYSSAKHYFDLCKEHKDANKYSAYCSAKTAASSGDWNAAATSYSSIKGFLDSDAELSNAYYQQVVSSESLTLDEAVSMLKNCTDGKGAELLKTCQYLQGCTGKYKCTERVGGTYTSSIKNTTFEMTFSVEKGVPSVNIYRGFYYHDTYIPTAPLTKTSGEYVYASTLKNEQIWFSQSKLKLVSDVFECSYYFAK